MQAMNIDRHNYESFFLLYTDNELDAAGRKAVEDFVRQNPDLEKELALLQQSVFPADEEVTFDGKQDLFRSEGRGIHTGNYEAFFLAYADDELGNEEKSTVEAFVYHHPQYQGELELLQAVRMDPDTSIVFSDKQSLYRSEKDDRVVPFRWWRLAAAALALLALGLWWMTHEKPAAPGNLAGRQNMPAAGPGQTPSAPQQAGKGVQQPIATAPETAAAGTEKKKAEGGADARPAPANNTLAKKSNARQEPVLATSPVKNDRPLAPRKEDQPLIAQANPPQADPAIDPAALPDRPNTSLNRNIRVNARPGMMAQAAAISRTDDNMISNAVYDANDDSNKDRIAIMNTSVNKNALRGLLRKASRVISKKTGYGDDDDNQKHILIGSFAIAVK